MKRNRKIMHVIYAFAFLAAGSSMALLLKPEVSAVASQEIAMPVPGVAMQADTTPNSPTPTPGTPTPKPSTPTPGTAAPGIIVQPPVITVTPTPAPPTLVSQGRPIITLDYTNYVAWLTVGPNDKYVVLEVMKSKKNKDGSYTYNPSAQYMYDLTEMAGQVIQKTIRIDLSFLKATSMQFIQIHGDANPANVSGVIAVNPQPKKPSIKYAGGVFTAKIDRQEVTLNQGQLEAYEYRTLYGSRWDSLRNFNGATSAIAGTTIMVREKAKPTAPAGVEAKIKIPAAAKAPKVTIDYVKGIINIPKGVEFKISARGKEGNWAVYKNEKGAEAAAKLTPTEILDRFIPYTGGPLTPEDKTAALEEEGFSIIARTKKVEKNGKVTKAASQPVFVTVPATTKVIKAEKEDKILGSVASIYLTYKNVEKGVELTAVGGSFDYSVDNGKNWKIVKADAKKPTVAVPKGDVKAVLIRESGAKAVTSKDGKVTPARLPSSNSIAASWLPPLDIDVAGQGLGVGTMIITAGEKAELNYGVSQGKDQITDAAVKHTTTLPAEAGLSVAGGKITFTAPAYNETGTNTYVIELTAEKTGYTAGVIKITVTVVKQ